MKQLKEIAQQNPNGFTVYLETLQPVKSGWAVALKETQNSFDDEGLRKVISIATQKTGIVGGWKEDGKLWWDAVQIFTDENEATQSGKENDQIAIYQIETNTVKYL